MGTCIAFIDPDGDYSKLLAELEKFSSTNNYEVYKYNEEQRDNVHNKIKERLNKFFNDDFMFAVTDKPFFVVVNDVSDFTKPNNAKLYRYKTKANYYVVLCMRSVDELGYELKVETDYMAYISTNVRKEQRIFFYDYNGNPYYDFKQFVKK